MTYLVHVFNVVFCFRNELFETRQLTVSKLFNLLKLSVEDSAKYVNWTDFIHISVLDWN